MSEPPDMGELLRQAMAFQEQLAAAQDEARHQVVTGRAGGGLVRVRMTGGGDVDDVEIAPEAIDPSDLELLEDLVLAAFRDAQEQVRQLQQSVMGGLTGLPGLGALGLGGEPEGG
jgi:DNA-binding YbaB/EbfC family protein